MELPIEREAIKLSKFLSLVLRHEPGKIGLALDENGWADTGELIRKMKDSGQKITIPALEYVVETNSKKRFAFNEDKSRIRASQGHSIDIDLDLKPCKPTDILFHGTSEKAVASIIETGIDKQERQYVHLSHDYDTAVNVGKRHGKPRVFEINSKQMFADGFHFYISENKVWLTGHVPSSYLRLL